MIRTSALGATGYVPNCSGTYNPCTEIMKAKLANIAVSSTLTQKCSQFTAACGKTGDQTAAANSVANLRANQAKMQANDQSGGAFNDANVAAGVTATAVPGTSLTTTGTTTATTTSIMNWVSANSTTVGVVGLVLAGLLVWKLVK